MEKLLEESLLYDFYGELLTSHQKDIYEDFVLNDLSLGEISQERGISRQGVYDIVKRCRRQLQSYEEKLHLVDRFMHIRKDISKIVDNAEDIINEHDLSEECKGSAVNIRKLCINIIDQL